MSALTTAGLVWRIYVAAEYPDRLTDFATLADGLEDLPWFVSEEEFRSAAAEFLAQNEE